MSHCSPPQKNNIPTQMGDRCALFVLLTGTSCKRLFFHMISFQRVHITKIEIIARVAFWHIRFIHETGPLWQQYNNIMTLLCPWSSIVLIFCVERWRNIKQSGDLGHYCMINYPRNSTDIVKTAYLPLCLEAPTKNAKVALASAVICIGVPSTWRTGRKTKWPQCSLKAWGGGD